MDGHEVHAVLGMRPHGCQQVVFGELDERLFHISDSVVHGDGPHHKRGLVDELLAELARLARVGEVHDGVGAQVLGNFHFLPLLGGVCLVAGDAKVYVHLGGKAFAYAKGTHALFDVDDICGDGDAAVCHALTDVFGVAMLSLGNLFHLRGDLSCARIVHLRDELIGLEFGHERCLPSLALPMSGSVGPRRARPISACRPRKLPMFVWPAAVIRACAQYTPRRVSLHPAEAEAARLKRSGVIKKDQGIFARKLWCIAVTDVESGELADVFDGMLCHPANH